MSLPWRLSLYLCLLLPLAGCTQSPKSIPEPNLVAPSAVPPAAEALLLAYPGHLSHFEDNHIVWRDGTRMVWDDGKSKSVDELLDHPDLEDMFGQSYPVDSVVFAPDFDPGRCRPDPFFKKIYGADASAVQQHLVDVDWFGQTLQFNRENGAVDSLKAVARELKTHPEWLGYLLPSAGTFNWRMVAGTQRLSNHSFGIAIDLHVKHAHYWRWSKEFKAGLALKWQNSLPMGLVKVFERHGFIWGGKWYHYDTMHFEFRPEQCRGCLQKG